MGGSLQKSDVFSVAYKTQKAFSFVVDSADKEASVAISLPAEGRIPDAI
jgi:hypothetical protein